MVNADGKKIDEVLERAKKEFFVEHDMWKFEHEKNNLKVYTSASDIKGKQIKIIARPIFFFIKIL